MPLSARSAIPTSFSRLPRTPLPSASMSRSRTPRPTRPGAKTCRFKLYSIIYELIDQVKEAMAGMLDPENREAIIGHAEVKKVFELSKGLSPAASSPMAGSRAPPGPACCADASQFTMAAWPPCKRFQDDVKEVRSGLECGIKLGDFNGLPARRYHRVLHPGESSPETLTQKLEGEPSGGGRSSERRRTSS